MKRIFVILVVCLLSVTAFAQKVSQKYIPEKDKPVLLVFTADWCAPCQAMKENVFTIDSVAMALNTYNVLMVDIGTPVGGAYQERFCKKVTEIPYFVVLDRYGAVKNRKLGAMQADAFIAFLRESGTLQFSALSSGPVKYVNVPDKDNYDKGWEFEVAAGGALSSASDTAATKPGVVAGVAARYRASRLVALKLGVEGKYTPAAVGYIPKVTITVPLDLELYMTNWLYASAGTYWAMHTTARTGNCGDFGFRVGAGGRIGNIDVKLTYNLGALNLNKGDIVNHVNTNALTVTAGYCF